MSKKTEFIGYIVTSCDVSETFDIHLAQMPDQDIDDSYHKQTAPFYIHAFDGGKKVRITVEEI